jgi:hypothetical protein
VGSVKHKEKEMSVHLLKKIERLQEKTFSGKTTSKNRSLKHKRGKQKQVFQLKRKNLKTWSMKERERGRKRIQN